MWHALTIEVLPGKWTTITFSDAMPPNHIIYMLMHGIETILEEVAGVKEPYLPGEFPVEEHDIALGISRWAKLNRKNHE